MSDAWPLEDQRKNPLARARHVAGMYRAALGLTNPILMSEIDELVQRYGEKWIANRMNLYDDSDLLTSAQAAEMLGVSVESIRQYRLRCRLPGIETVDGWRYLARDVRDFRAMPSGRPKNDS